MHPAMHVHIFVMLAQAAFEHHHSMSESSVRIASIVCVAVVPEEGVHGLW